VTEPILVLARVKKINTVGMAHNEAKSFELEPLAIVEMYPPKAEEKEKEEASD
jgi:hypothetical protein